MPYKSRAQAAYFNIHRKELERQGVDVDEWNESSRGKKLPKHVVKDKKGMLDVEELLKEAAPKLPPSYYRNLYYRNPELHKLKSSNGGLASAAKAKQEAKRLAHVADRDGRLDKLKNPPPPPQGELDFGKQAADHNLQDVLTGSDLSGQNKYILGKNELEKPRELSNEEEARLKMRRAGGWSLFNPLYDIKKRDVFHHIQNPGYRAGTDVLTGSLLQSLIPMGYAAYFGKHMGLQGRNKALLMGALATMSSLPEIIGIKNKYKKQKLYNDIAESYIRNHQEGAIETMPTVLKDTLAKAKNVNSLKLTKKKIKKAAYGDFNVRVYNTNPEPGPIRKFINDHPTLSKILSNGKKMWPFIPVVPGVWGGISQEKRERAELNDLRERFERKVREKAEADIFVQKLKMPLYRKHEGVSDKIQKFEDMFKTSSDKSPMLPHQKRVIDRLSQADQPGLILMHGLGSGKTRSSIEAYKDLGLPAEVILPAALRENYKKELHKWLGKAPKDVTIKSQQEVARKGIDPSELDNKLMIIDEAHRLRNEDTKLYKNLKHVNPAKRLLLTGTPIYNDPSDIAKLINLAAGRNVLPDRKAEFDKEYISQKTVFPTIGHRLLGVSPGQELGVKNPEYLRRVFHKLIDYHAGNEEGFPDVTHETLKVPMAEKQQQIYKALMKELPWYLRMKVSAGLPPDRKELDKLLPFLSGARMISNTTSGFDRPENARAPKIEQAFKYFKEHVDSDPSYKGLVYSNYLDNGVQPYKKLLDEAHIPYGEFTGDVKDSVRNQLVKDYNDNKLRALLVSSAGGEGLDLKGTRLVQLLEPHFNNEKIKQVIGRAARYRSHEGLPKDKQSVLIQHYLSSLNPSYMEQLRRKSPVSSDEYMQNLSDQKEQLNNEFIKLIKE